MREAIALCCATGAFAPKRNRMSTPPGEFHRLWRQSRCPAPSWAWLHEDTDAFPDLREGLKFPLDRWLTRFRGPFPMLSPTCSCNKGSYH